MKHLNKLTKLEIDVMEFLLKGNNDVLEILREQYSNVIDISRTNNNGYGYYIYFIIRDDINKLNEINNIKLDFCFGDVIATVEGLKNGAGFLLWVKNGLIHMLEVYSYEEEWPKEILGYKVFYIDNRRTIEELSKIWEI